MAARDSLPGDSGRGKRGRATAAVVAGAAVGLIVGLIVGAFAFGDGEGDGRGDARAPQPTLERIAANPQEFVGEPAFLSGVVREIISPRAFTLSRPGLGSPELLVVTKSPLAVPTGRSATRPILEGDLAQVGGDVRRFDIAAFERELGVDLRRDFDSLLGKDLGEREGDPAVQATAVTFTSGTTPVVESASPDAIEERPQDFYDRITSVEGRVTDILPSGALVIDDTLLALTPDFAQGRPREGQRVTIVGPVRRFDPDQRRPEGRTLPDDRLLERFADRPAVVAQSVEIER
jgi:hypothetical protein